MPTPHRSTQCAATFRRFTLPPAAIAFLICGCSALAQTITVTTLYDVVDFAAGQQVADLPGPDGKVSFREACLAASNTPGQQTIAFAIPQSEWWLNNTMAILRLEQGVFAIIGSSFGGNGDGTILDFTTQTDFTGDTNPNGNEVGIYGLQPNGWGSPAIVINADNVLVKGLGNVWQRGNAVSIRGSDNKVQGCTVSSTIHAAIEIGGNYGGPPASNNLIGGTDPGEGNTLSGATGVRIINPATDNVIVGNRLSGSSFGVWIIGNQYTGYVYNNRVGGPTPEERNIISDAGSYCCEGAPSGGQVMLEWAVDTIVENNYIGVSADGMSGAGQIGPVGIGLRRAPGTILRDNVIGDIVAVGVNHHAGQLFGVAIDVTSESDDVIIQGNRIGVGADGVTPIPNLRGIAVAPWIPASEAPNNVLIGGTSGGGEGNIIAHSSLTGVRITGAGVSGITVRGNSIHSNGGLGIDLDAPGVTPNDPLDADTGPNGNQNFPVLGSAETAGSSLHVNGTLHSKPNGSFWIDLYASEQPHASGHGEGEAYVGSSEVMTNGSGDAAFDLTFAASVPPGWFISATATEQPTGNTSEFALSIEAEAGDPIPGTPGDLNGDGTVGVDDLLILLAAWGGCSDCDACPADLTGDCAVGVDDLLTLLANWG